MPDHYKISGLVGEALQNWDLLEGETRVGRSSEFEIFLPDRSVSRLHAVIRRDGDKLVLEDRQSRNGTSVNGMRIASPHVLVAGDQIAFGNVLLRLGGADSSLQAKWTDHTQLDSTYRLNWQEVREPEASPEEGAQLMQVLIEMGEFLVHHQPQEEIFEACLDTVQKLLAFQRAFLLIIDEDGKPQMRAARFRNESANTELALSQTMVQTVILERASLLVRDAQSDTRFQAQQSVILGKIRSALVTPLFDNTRVIGVLYVDTSELSVAYTKSHLRQLALLGNILAVKISNARLLDVQRDQERLQLEMATAARIQRTLLEESPACPAGYELSVRLEPCTEVGGDLYDVLPLGSGSFAIVLGDVVGHGVGAAMLMANALATLRALADLCVGPEELLSRLQEQMSRTSGPTSYLTMFVGILDPATHRMSYANAGHEPPAILRAGHETVHLQSTGPPIGLLPSASFTASSAEIPAGAIFAAWSDGIPEAHVAREEGEVFFGEEQPLEDLLLEYPDAPVAEIANTVFERVDAFLNGAPAPDDRTLLLLRRLA